jgi:hypothetical protein
MVVPMIVVNGALYIIKKKKINTLYRTNIKIY